MLRLWLSGLNKYVKNSNMYTLNQTGPRLEYELEVADASKLYFAHKYIL